MNTCPGSGDPDLSGRPHIHQVGELPVQEVNATQAHPRVQDQVERWGPVDAGRHDDPGALDVDGNFFLRYALAREEEGSGDRKRSNNDRKTTGRRPGDGKSGIAGEDR